MDEKRSEECNDRLHGIGCHEKCRFSFSESEKLEGSFSKMRVQKPKNRCFVWRKRSQHGSCGENECII